MKCLIDFVFIIISDAEFNVPEPAPRPKDKRMTKMEELYYKALVDKHGTNFKVCHSSCFVSVWVGQTLMLRVLCACAACAMVCVCFLCRPWRGTSS